MSVLSERDLYESFRTYGVGSNNMPETELYLPLNHAVDFLNACVECDFAAARVEGFRYENGIFEPRIAWIADYDGRDPSWIEYQAHANRFVRDFLEDLKRQGANVATFVVYSEADYLTLT